MSNGFLRICTRAAADSLPVPGVTVLVTLPDGSSRSIVTDSSGCAQPLAVEAPDRRFSLDEDNTAVLPYAVCALSAAPPGYAAVTLRGVQIFDGVTTLADLNLVQCHRSINYIAEMMETKYGMPWLKVNFIGIESTNESLRQVARCFNDPELTKRTEEVIARETARVMPVIA